MVQNYINLVLVLPDNLNPEELRIAINNAMQAYYNCAEEAKSCDGDLYAKAFNNKDILLSKFKELINLMTNP